MDFRTLFFGAILPGLVCGGLLYGFLALGRNRPKHVWTTASGLALAIAYLVAQLGILGWNGWPPVQSRDWLGPLAVLIGLWSAVEVSLPLGTGLRWGARALCAAAIGYVSVRIPLGNVLRDRDSLFDGLSESDSLPLLGEWLVVALCMLAAWQTWLRLGNYLSVRSTVLAGIAVCLAAAYAQHLSASNSGAQMHGALVAAFVACLVAAMWRPDRNFGPGFAGVLAALQLGLLQDGTRGADLPLSSALLLYFAPAFLLVAHVLLPDTLPFLTRWGARVAALLVPIALALVIAKIYAPEISYG
jgi:hypothetical protein